MGLFGWFKKKDRVPDWAHGLDNKQYRALWDTAVEWFSDHGVEVIADENEGTLEPQSGFLQGSHFSLLNLSRIAINLKPEEISMTVTGFLQNQWDSMEETATVKSHSYDRVSPQSRVRLFASDPEMETFAMAGKKLNEELMAVICLDLSRSTVSVSLDDLATWGISLEAAFDEALKLTLNDFRSQLAAELPFISGRNYGFEMQESFFVSSVILGLPELFEPAPRLGVLAGVPTRSMLLCLGIDEQISMKEVEQVGSLAVSVYQEGAGPVSPGLYWLFEGEVLALSDGAVWERFSEVVLK